MTTTLERGPFYDRSQASEARQGSESAPAVDISGAQSLAPTEEATKRQCQTGAPMNDSLDNLVPKPKTIRVLGLGAADAA
jgi:hypothetical protein